MKYTINDRENITALLRFRTIEDDAMIVEGD